MGPPTVALPKYDSSWKDGGVGDRVKSCQRRLAFVHDTGRVDLDGFLEDRRVSVEAWPRASECLRTADYRTR